MGFDGFLDTLMQVVKDKPANQLKSYFREIDEFGQYISGKKGSGFSLETETKLQKLGGNMPITAHALGSLGVKVECIGAMGYPVVHPAFTEMNERCQLHSFENPGITSALEFADGKMMLCEMEKLNRVNWQLVKERIGLEKIRELISGTDLLCLLNWSELDGSTGFWQGLLTDVFPFVVNPKNIFIDLSDCSGRSKDAILEAILLIKNLNEISPVTLSLNRNETGILLQVLDIAPKNALAEQAGELFSALKIHQLVIHSAKNTLAFNGEIIVENEPAFIAQPNITTGAGDHFNAGFCLGILNEADTINCLRLGNKAAGFYMQNGHSPKTAELTGL